MYACIYIYIYIYICLYEYVYIPSRDATNHAHVYIHPYIHSHNTSHITHESFYAQEHCWDLVYRGPAIKRDVLQKRLWRKKNLQNQLREGRPFSVRVALQVAVYFCVLFGCLCRLSLCVHVCISFFGRVTIRVRPVYIICNSVCLYIFESVTK